MLLMIDQFVDFCCSIIWKTKGERDKKIDDALLDALFLQSRNRRTANGKKMCVINFLQAH